MCYRHSMQFGMIISLLLVRLLSLNATPVYAETSPQSPPDAAKIIEAAVPDQAAETQEVPFEYMLEDREDPFIPFLTERATTSDVDMNEIVESTEKLTGMQLFEPGQLTLVALMRQGSQDMAMVEDVTGKGYMIEEGTKIGRRGVVKDIIPNKVVIEETAVTRAGKKIVTQIVMVLKKEGEE